jgi:hypothetical protein
LSFHGKALTIVPLVEQVLDSVDVVVDVVVLVDDIEIFAEIESILEMLFVERSLRRLKRRFHVLNAIRHGKNSTKNSYLKDSAGGEDENMSTGYVLRRGQWRLR